MSRKEGQKSLQYITLRATGKPTTKPGLAAGQSSVRRAAEVESSANYWKIEGQAKDAGE